MPRSVLGDAMAAAAQKLRGEAAGELVVVPVPLFAAREKTRGFNQARLLAEGMVKRLRRLEPGWRLRLALRCAGAGEGHAGAVCAESYAAPERV